MEHGITPEGQVTREDKKGEDCKEIFFNEANCGQKWVPRAVLVDLEPRVLHEICNSELNCYSNLFDVDNTYQGPTGGGAGNNWARGFNQGSDVMDEILAIVEAEAERVDHLEGFAVCHSILGGTGSGLGSRILQELRDRFPKSVIQTYSTVQPMTCNVQVAPYNSVLSLDAIMQHADMCLLFDNDAFEKQCKAANPLQRLRKVGASNEDLLKTSMASAAEKKNYSQINSMMSQVMTSLSAPMRFYSPIYTRLMHITAMLNPFPPMIFSQPAIVPFVSTREEGPKQQLVKFPEPKNVLSHLLDPRNLISSSPMIVKRQREGAAELHQRRTGSREDLTAAKDDQCLLSGLIVLQSTEADPVTRLAAPPIAGLGGIGDLYQHIRRRSQTHNNVYKSPPWMPSSMNLTHCRLSPYMKHEQNPITGLLLANHTSVSLCLRAICGDFEKMWKKRANVHAFESAFEVGGDRESGKKNMEEKMTSSKENLDALLHRYAEACTERFMDLDLELQHEEEENISPHSNGAVKEASC